MGIKLGSICVFAKSVNGLLSGCQVGESLGVKSIIPPAIKIYNNSPLQPIDKQLHPSLTNNCIAYYGTFYRHNNMPVTDALAIIVPD